MINHQVYKLYVENIIGKLRQINFLTKEMRRGFYYVINSVDDGYEYYLFVDSDSLKLIYRKCNIHTTFVNVSSFEEVFESLSPEVKKKVLFNLDLLNNDRTRI